MDFQIPKDKAIFHLSIYVAFDVTIMLIYTISNFYICCWKQLTRHTLQGREINFQTKIKLHWEVNNRVL